MKTNPDKEQKEPKGSAKNQAAEKGAEGSEAQSSRQQGPRESGIKMPDTPKIELPKGGGALRSIGEKFQVNPVTGTCSFSVPIAITAGRNGFTPALALSYNSGSGNSPFGLGWSVGVPSISRKTQQELPQYRDAKESDTFLMSGAEDLVPALTEVDGEWVRDEYTETGYKVLRYRPRIEGMFARIERWIDTTTGISHWKSITAENVSTLYGKSAGSRIADPDDATRIFEWLIEESWDDKGNALRYEYKQEDNAGVLNALWESNRLLNGNANAQLYLKTVRYGNTVMHDDPNFASTTDWHYRLVFDYGEHDAANPTESTPNTWNIRQDPFSTYRSGFEIRTRRLCQRILMFHNFTELGGSALVKATNLNYDANAVATRLTRVVHKSYQSGETPAEMPPLDFTYTEATMDDTLRHFDIDDLENLPMGVDGQQYTWSDLDGEGITGVLAEYPGGWFYKRNYGDESYYQDYPVNTPPDPDIRFGALETVALKPNTGGIQQLGDFDGDGRTELLVRNNDLTGYFRLDHNGEWQNFRHFENAPNIDWEDPNLRLIDLNGDGVPDVLLSTDHCFRYYPSKEDKGYEEALEFPPCFDEEQGPRIVFADAEQVIHLADMNGDGLTDIVRVRNGEVCYWPSLGHGRFGARVSMSNAPRLDFPEQFDKNRVRLADMDGSGTTDLVYLGISKVSYWNNQSGNSFSLEKDIFLFPRTNNMTSVTVMDLFGKGTSCLVWSSPLAGDIPYRIRYIDLFGEKPYLLREVNNNMGGIGRYHYAPSTRFYLRDRQEGRPWITKLPFPVQVVERTEKFDEVTGARFVSRYAYHHGYFDHHEKEFRGFGMVEQWDTEQYEKFGQAGLFQVGSNALDEESHIPPVHTKTWFHLGYWEREGSITQQYASEYYNQDNNAWPLPDSTLPSNLNAEEMRQAMRALKGQVLRSEVYADDESLLAADPYTVSSANYLVKNIQPLANNKYAVFQVIPRESLNYQYERHNNDPRISHSAVLEVNAYGIPTKSADIAYPRRASAGLAPQDEGRIVYTEAEFIHLTGDTSQYRINIPSTQRAYEISGIAFSSSAPLQPAALLAAIGSATPINYEDSPSGGVEKRLVSATKAYYYNTNASAALAFGQAAYHALPHHTLTLALTPGLVDDAFNTGSTRVTETMLLTEGFYVKEDNLYWIPSGVLTFDNTQFYAITEQTDPFGNTVLFNYDSYFLVPVESIDPLGNTTTATIDYRLMSISQITDPNGNRRQVGFDALGMVTKVAVMGKTTESLGDTLSNPTQQLTYDLFNWMNNGKPNYVMTQMREQHGGTPSWLTSYEYSGGMGQVIMQKVQAEPGDAFERDVNGELVLDINGDPQLAFADPRWVGTGRTVFNNKGKAVKQYEPYFSSTYAFEDEDEVRTYGVTPVIHYDPLGRAIRTDMPDGTFTRVEFDCWQQKNYDQNDTVIGSQWYIDRNSPSVAGGEPTDPDERAAWLAGKHFDTPQVLDIDVLGRVFRTRDDNGSFDGTSTTNVYYDVTLELDIEGKKRTVSNALGQNTVFTYGMLPLDEEGNGVILYTDSPDGGWRMMLPNVAGNLIRGWDERGHAFRNEYDELQRPTHNWVNEGSGELLAGFLVYGDNIGLSTPEDDNLRNQVVRSFDQSGVLEATLFDFKGNVLSSTQILATVYNATVDWSAVAAETTLNDIDNTASASLESETFDTSITYDAMNRPVTITLPDATVIRPAYNEAGILDGVDARVRGAVSWTGFVTNIDYNAKGQRDKIVYANGAQTRYTYDPDTFRLTRLLTTRNSGVDILQDLNYTFDPVGNITALRDDAQQTHYFQNAVVSPNGKYSYDALYRLIQATGREHSNQGQVTEAGFPFNTPVPHVNNATAVETYTEQYQYDALGNILKLIHQAGSGNWTRGYHYDTASNNRLLKTSLPGDNVNDPNTYSASYTHDTHGNMTSMPHLSSMQWDYQDRLRQVDLGGGGTAYYVYNASGERVRKVIENGGLKKDRIYLGNISEVYREYTGSSIDLERESLHILDDQRRIALVETLTIQGGVPVGTPTPVIKYQLGNHLDSASLELDASSANVITYEEFHPFGSSSYRLGTNTSEVSLKRYRYVGKEHDEESGLYYYGARYYAGWLCRFVSVDPLKDDYPFYTTFQYAGNNPITFFDLDGNETTENKTTNVQTNGQQSTYTIKSGDTFWDLENTLGLEHGSLQEWNPSLEPTKLSIGQKINIQDPSDTPVNNSTQQYTETTYETRYETQYVTEYQRSWNATAGALVISGGLVADDATVVGVVDDVAIPFILLGALAYDAFSKTKPVSIPITVPITVPVTRTRTKELPITYVTYTKYNPTTGETYVGRTSGYGDPLSIVRARDAAHHKTAQGFGPAVIDKFAVGTLPYSERWADPAYQAIRGREQQIIDAYGGAWSTVGRGNTKSGNAINGISPTNLLRSVYLAQATLRFGTPPRVR